VKIGEQLLTVVRAPAAPSLLRSRAWGLLVIYLGLAVLLLGGLGVLVASQQEQLCRALLGYVLPDRLVFAGELLLRYVVNSQAQAVLVNAFASGTLVVVAVLLFPVKEKLSAVFEQESGLTGQPVDEFPLWRQGLEELKLLILYAAAFAGIFWIGYAPGAGRKLAATVLSYGFLFFSFSVDFISPLLQRHRVSYAQALMVLLRHCPAVCLGFGALFATPALLAGLALKHNPGLSFTGGVALLFCANILGIVWAAVAGTWVAARLLPTAKQTRAAPAPLRALVWLAMLAVLGWSGWVFTNLGAALHHKSQILKCRYSADWRSFRFDLPELGLRSAVTSLVAGTVPVGAHLTVRVQNPTDIDVALERNRIELRHEETLVARTKLAPMRVPAGQTVEQRLDFTMELNPRALLKGQALLSRGWRITLLLEISPSFEFPVYLLDPGR
jgi:hypothetical protein